MVRACACVRFTRVCARVVLINFPQSLTGQAFCTKQNDCRIVSERKGGGKPGFSAS
nr:MAG TPA: hypothetical protein [Microviridae sp.]